MKVGESQSQLGSPAGRGGNDYKKPEHFPVCVGTICHRPLRGHCPSKGEEEEDKVVVAAMKSARLAQAEVNLDPPAMAPAIMIDTVTTMPLI